MTIHLTPDQFEAQRRDALRANPPEVMDAPELALYLGLSEGFIRLETAAGRIPCKHLGRAVRYDTQTIRAWMKPSAAAKRPGRKPGAVTLEAMPRGAYLGSGGRA